MKGKIIIKENTQLNTRSIVFSIAMRSFSHRIFRISLLFQCFALE